MGSEDWAMEENDGFGLRGGSVAEVVDVAVGTQAADDRGTGWSVDGLTLGADWNFAVVADAHPAALAPDVGPPGTRGRRTDDRAFFGEGMLVGLVRGGPEFAVDFVVVGVGDELVQELVGSDQFEDAVGGQWCGKTVSELKFFMARKMAGSWIFRFGTDSGRRAGPAAGSLRRACRLSGFRRRSSCVPAEPYPPLKQG